MLRVPLWMTIDNFPLWHASLRHPAGNIPLPEGEPCVYKYLCEIFVCLKMWHNANISLNVAFFRNDPHATSTAGWR